MMSYHFGFSWKGLIVFLLPMIPNFFYFLIPTSSVPGTTNSHLTLNILEHGSQVMFIFLLIFVTRKQAPEILCPYTIGMAILLTLYFLLWILYFAGNINLVILLGMAVLPVLYFIVAEMWLYNYLALIPTILFGIVHIIITYIDFQSTYF